MTVLDVEEIGTTAQVAELYAALAAVQAELPAVRKNRTADAGTYSYTYADLADVSAAIMPVLGRHGLAFTCLPGHQPDGKFGLPYKLVHKSGASLEGFWAIPEQANMQTIGGRITYARRYCLCAVTGITADEDTDAREDMKDASPAETARASGNAPVIRERAPQQRSAGEARNPAPAVQDPPAPAAGAVPDDTDWDTPGTVPPDMLTAIWARLREDFGFRAAEKDKARQVCARIVKHELETSGNLSKTEAQDVLDTLANWRDTAKENRDTPRNVLDTILKDAAEVPDA